MEIAEDKVYSQVYGLIKLVGKEYQDMLPDKVKKTIENKRDKNYTPKYSVDIPLEKQNIYSDSMAILANIQYNYWCKTAEEKKAFLDELKQNDIDRENKLREMYNPDNIFRKKQVEKKEEKQQSVALAEIHKNTLMSRIIGFFNRLFKKIVDR